VVHQFGRSSRVQEQCLSLLSGFGWNLLKFDQREGWDGVRHVRRLNGASNRRKGHSGAYRKF
jgi:hypothetical protein